MRRYDQNAYKVFYQVELQSSGINNQRKRGTIDQVIFLGIESVGIQA